MGNLMPKEKVFGLRMVVWGCADLGSNVTEMAERVMIWGTLQSSVETTETQGKIKA